MDALVNKPRTKRGRATLNNILSAAAQVIYERGYHAASIHEITKLAGVASGTFYVYFDGKYNLYKYLLLQCSRTIRKHLHQAVAGCTSRREIERVGMRAWLEFTLKNRYMYHIIWESLYVDKQLFVDYYAKFCAAYMRGLDADKRTGEVRGIDSEVLAYTLMGASNFLGLNWGLFKENVGAAEIERVTDEFMKIMDAGIFNAEYAARPTEGGQAEQAPIRVVAFFEDDESDPEPGDIFLG